MYAYANTCVPGHTPQISQKTYEKNEHAKRNAPRGKKKQQRTATTKECESKRGKMKDGYNKYKNGLCIGSKIPTTTTTKNRGRMKKTNRFLASTKKKSKTQSIITTVITWSFSLFEHRRDWTIESRQNIYVDVPFHKRHQNQQIRYLLLSTAHSSHYSC